MKTSSHTRMAHISGKIRLNGNIRAYKYLIEFDIFNNSQGYKWVTLLRYFLFFFFWQIVVVCSQTTGHSVYASILTKSFNKYALGKSAHSNIKYLHSFDNQVYFTICNLVALFSKFYYKCDFLACNICNSQNCLRER